MRVCPPKLAVALRCRNYTPWTGHPLAGVGTIDDGCYLISSSLKIRVEVNPVLANLGLSFTRRYAIMTNREPAFQPQLSDRGGRRVLVTGGAGYIGSVA